MTAIIFLIVMSVEFGASVYYCIKAEKVHDEAQALLDLIEEKQQEEIKCNTQMVNKLTQDAYNNGYNDGYVKVRSLNRKRKKK